MTAKHWSVWSLSPDGKNWLEVAQEMPEGDAWAAAARKREIAAKHGLADAQFVALPQGRVPTDAAQHRTRSGEVGVDPVLTEAEVQALADEAERGYDVEELARQPKRINVDRWGTSWSGPNE